MWPQVPTKSLSTGCSVIPSWSFPLMGFRHLKRCPLALCCAVSLHLLIAPGVHGQRYAGFGVLLWGQELHRLLLEALSGLGSYTGTVNDQGGGTRVRVLLAADVCPPNPRGCCRLLQVAEEWAQGTFKLNPDDEDIHTANERRLKVPTPPSASTLLLMLATLRISTTILFPSSLSECRQDSE